MKPAAVILAGVAAIFSLCPLQAGLANDGAIDVAVVVFDGVLTSDAAAPLEVFGAAAKKPWPQSISIRAVALGDMLTVTTEEGLRLTASALLKDAGDYDAVIIPSRYDMDSLLKNRTLINFVQRQSTHAAWMASNCSGALVLAEAGVLNGKQATTWAGGEKSFQQKYPAVLVQEDVNVVIDDGVLTSNGSVVSYEAAIALLAQLTDDALAGEVAHDLQFARVANATTPPRIYWEIVFVFAGAAAVGAALIALALQAALKRKFLSK
jgi:transcriptional regulator GlxA family with amidase domain